MADNIAAEYGKRPWAWFETQILYLEYPQINQDQIDAHLNQEWTELPRDYKDSVAPALFKVYETFQRMNIATAARNNTDGIPLEAWQHRTQDELTLYVDGFATADERLVVLKKLRDANIECQTALQELIRARDIVADRKWHSIESVRAMPKVVAQANAAVTGSENEVQKLEAELPRHHEMEESWRKRRIDVGLPAGAGWVGSWFLGGGSFGKAFLWVRQDAQARIVDRLVTKDAAIDEKMLLEHQAWVLHEGVYIPTEVRAPQMLAGKPGSETILIPRGWREFPSRDMFRVLMEFCPHGDLFDLRFGTYGGSASSDPFEPKMPQAFLWYVFECLATAGVLMEKGALQPEALQGWQQIFHSDIKLANIMLAPPDPAKYCKYPRPVMADFGFAQFCPLGERRMGRGGTPGCESPENSGTCFNKAGQLIRNAKLNRRSDVWSVGNIILALMTMAEADQALNFRADPSPREPPVHDLEGEYGHVLLDLVDECMRYYAEDRISFEPLLKRIRRYTGDYDFAHDHVRGLRGAAADDPMWQAKKNTLSTPVDKFPLYSQLVRIPDGRSDIPQPPHKTRKLSKQMEYKGPVSADTKSLRRAGSVRKHAAQHSKQEHERFLTKRRKLEDLKKRGGFNVPDSDDDDDSGNGEEIESLENWVAQGAAANGPDRVPDSFDNGGDADDAAATGPQQAVDDMEVEPAAPTAEPRASPRKSRSAAAGAGPTQHWVPNFVGSEESDAPPQRTRSQARDTGAITRGTLLFEQPERQQPAEDPAQPPSPHTRSQARRSRSSAKAGAKGSRGKKRVDRSASPARNPLWDSRPRTKSELARATKAYLDKCRREREVAKAEEARKKAEQMAKWTRGRNPGGGAP